MRLTPVLLLLVGCTGGNDSGDTGVVPEDHRQPEFCTDPTVSVTAGDMWEVRSDHYDLWVGNSWSEEEAETFGLLLESAWPAYESYFGAPAIHPDGGQLEVFFFDTQSEWGNAITADGLGVPWGAGGLYHPSTSRAYLWRQPEIYTNRMLLLHEVGHQFHGLSTGTQAGLGWFVEGVVMYLERHDWYQGCLRLGVVPTGTLEDFHGTALADWEAGLDLEDLVSGEANTSRPDAMAFWAYLEEEHTDAFREYRDTVDSGTDDEFGAFQASLGAPDGHGPDFEDWLRSHQEPIDVLYSGWRHVDHNHIEGDTEGTGSITSAVVKEPGTRFEALFEPDSASYSAGVVLGFEDWSNWSAVAVDQDGGITTVVLSSSGGQWGSLEAVEAPDGGTVIAFDISDDTSLFTVNDEERTLEHGQAGSSGLAVIDTRAVFEVFFD